MLRVLLNFCENISVNCDVVQIVNCCVPRVKCHNMDAQRDCRIDPKVSRMMDRVNLRWRFLWKPSREPRLKWPCCPRTPYLPLNRRYSGSKVSVEVHYTTSYLLFDRVGLIVRHARSTKDVVELVRRKRRFADNLCWSVWNLFTVTIHSSNCKQEGWKKYK